MLKNGAVEFYDVKQNSEACDFVENIPLGEYLYEERLPDEYVAVTDFGAAPDADYRVNTKAINEAISVVSQNGGGTVVIPEGIFLSSTVVLRSGVTLFVKGTLRCIDYETNKKAESRLAEGEYIVSSRTREGFIYADGAKNIAICGGGRIEGSGATYCQEAKCPEKLLPLEKFHLKTYIMQFRNRIRFEKLNSGRVNLIELCNCEGVDIHNIELYESAAWTCNIFQGDGITVENVVINNNYHVANSDGFDLSCCSNAVIRHCYIATGDDALCIKADGNKDVENILIEDCKAMSLANCFKIGTTVYRNVRNVTVRNCEFFNDNTTGGYAGISIQSDCGGSVSDILVENIRMDGVTSPFLVWLGDRNGIEPGEMKNITIRNIAARNVSLPSAVTGVVHQGREYNVKNILISKVDAVYRDSDEEIYVREGGVGYEAMQEYPEITRLCSIYTTSHELSPYWELPVYGLFVRNAEGITVESFTCTPRSVNKRPADNLTDTNNGNSGN